VENEKKPDFNFACQRRVSVTRGELVGLAYVAIMLSGGSKKSQPGSRRTAAGAPKGGIVGGRFRGRKGGHLINKPHRSRINPAWESRLFLPRGGFKRKWNTKAK